MIKTIKQRVILRREQTVRRVSLSIFLSGHHCRIFQSSGCLAVFAWNERVSVTAKSFRSILTPLLVYAPYEYVPCISRQADRKGETSVERCLETPDSLLVMRMRPEYIALTEALATIIFNRQLLPAKETVRKRGRGTMARASDDYNFSVSITVAACLAAIFQRPKVHATAPHRLDYYRAT